MPVAAGATASPAQEDVEPPAAVPPVVSFCTAPDRYRHWRVAVDGQVATVTLTVDENGALVAGYELKMNSYDLGVDIELYDLVQRLRFEHPSVKSVVMTGGLERMFCAGANIRMLAQSSHAWKVNFCKFTNETRNGIEDATASSGQTWIAALNGTAAGGGYELALACEQIVLIDDGSSVVSLPEVSMLGVLPGTGGLTRVVDKRHVRKDRADLFATKPEGYRGQTAVQWGLVDATVARHGFADEITRRATEAAATSTRPSDAQGVQLTRLTRQDCGDEITYPYVTAKIAIDLAPEVGHFVLAGAGALPALSTASARGWEDFIALGRESQGQDRTVAGTDEDACALWLYTSGTTGSPKGAMHRHANIRHVCQTYGEQVLGIRPQDVCLSVAKLFFADGLGNSAWFPLSAGATTVLEPRHPTAQVIAGRMSQDKPTIFCGVPTFFAHLVASDLPDDAFASVRLAVSAGEPLPAPLQHRFTDRFGVEIIDGIGSTESLHIFLSNRPGDVHPGTTGPPVPGYELQLRDAGGGLVALGQPGTLYVRGESTAQGYWRRTAASRHVFVGEWLNTGDTYLETRTATTPVWGPRSSSRGRQRQPAP